MKRRIQQYFRRASLMCSFIVVCSCGAAAQTDNPFHPFQARTIPPSGSTMVHVYRVGGVMVGARRVAVLYGRYSERSGVHIAMPGDTLPGGYRVKLISLERVVITRNGRDYVLSAPR